MIMKLKGNGSNKVGRERGGGAVRKESAELEKNKVNKENWQKKIKWQNGQNGAEFEKSEEFEKKAAEELERKKAAELEGKNFKV